VATVGELIYQPFSVGGGRNVAVSVADCSFSLAPLRRNVAVNMALSFTYRNKVYTTQIQTDSISCRN
jgi:hypothetical protein